jgi:hypothetical protein
MSAPITEAHRRLAQSINGRWCSHDEGAQLIAESEARAVTAAVTMLTCIQHTDQQRADCPVCVVKKLRAEVERLKTERYKHTDDPEMVFTDDLGWLHVSVKAEFDELTARAERAEAEVKQLKADGAASAFIAMSCRASRAEVELTAERARLDAVIYHCWIIHKGNENAYAVRSLGEYITHWVATPRAAIDAAMKQPT